MEENLTFAYLSSSTLGAISSSLALAANIALFECTELWTREPDGSFYCPYVHATSDLLNRCPHLSTGYHPRDKLEHFLSPKLCNLARQSPTRHHWRTFESNERPIHDGYSDVSFPVFTEMAYYVENTGDVELFIVGLSVERLPFRPSTFKLLQGLGYVIYVTEFLMCEDKVTDEESNVNAVELDTKAFFPAAKILSTVNLAVSSGHNSQIDFAAINNLSDNNLKLKALANAARMSIVNQESLPVEAVDVGLSLIDDDEESLHQSESSFARRKSTGSAQSDNGIAMDSRHRTEDGQSRHQESPSASTREKGARPVPNSSSIENLQKLIEGLMPRGRAPTWEPAYPFSFPVSQIASKRSIPDNMKLKDFGKLVHFKDGSNSNVFTAVYEGDKVIIKMIKKGAESDAIALHEFDLEYSILSRVDHPNIIRILGGGQDPRRFMVLEYLAEGTLVDVMKANENVKRGFSGMMFRKPSFTYLQLLQKALEMANALEYLHFKCHMGATIIHRDLKPENIGFSSDMTLKLFDFGLVSCVKTRERASDSYQLSGYTGSLRYMAPEVALREAYSEKVDVYSFGIMLWQMASDNIPFAGLGKTAFMQEVVRGGVRPKLDRNWPAGFQRLLTNCWDRNPENRPSFKAIQTELGSLMALVQSGSNSSDNSQNSPMRIIRGLTDRIQAGFDF